jgi:hypothetical protein
MPKKNPQRIPAKHIFKNLTKPTKTIPLLTKTTLKPHHFLPKPYYFLTLFVGIFHFLRFCADTKPLPPASEFYS